MLGVERSPILGVACLLGFKWLHSVRDAVTVEITGFLNQNHPAQPLIHSINVSEGIPSARRCAGCWSHGGGSSTDPSCTGFPG